MYRPEHLYHRKYTKAVLFHLRILTRDTYHVTISYNMIKHFRNRGLKRLYERGDKSRINPAIVDKVEAALGLLDVAEAPNDVDLTGYMLHPLRGNLQGFWSIRVSGNWRITFRFDNGDVYDVNLEDYH